MAIQELLYMQPIFPRIETSQRFKATSRVILQAALGLVLLQTPLPAEEGATEERENLGFLLPPEREEIHNTPSLKNLEKKKDTYTINFNNVAITEYIRFASKITNLNFIFNENELKFNVTIVSEEPVTPSNIVSILIQTLRINGLVVLEQDGNLLITSVKNVSQLATVVSSDLPPSDSRSPLVTRVFRIKNASLGTIASIIKPMLSDTALLEVSAETKQLIVTDITTNVDKISTLLATIDAPHSPLEVDTYVAKSVNLEPLISIVTQIVTPFAEGNPLLFIPQSSTGTIFIVSTPYLIERALAVFEDVDSDGVGQKGLSSRGMDIFLYPLQHKTANEFLLYLGDLSKQLTKQGISQKLVDCLSGARLIKDSNSILFLADQETLVKLKELLPTLDNAQCEPDSCSQKSQFFVYKIKFADPELLQNSLDQMAEKLQSAPQPDYTLIDTLTSSKYIPEAQSLVFTGDTASLARTRELLEIFDITPLNNQVPQFFVYNAKHHSPAELKTALEAIIDNQKAAGYGDSALRLAVSSMQWTPGTNSIIFSGNPEALSRIQALLISLDGPTESSFDEKKSFFVYKLHYASGSTVVESLKKIADSLKESDVTNQALIQSLQDAKWVRDNNSILLTGSPAVVDQVKALIQEFDVSASSLPIGGKSAFLIYKPTQLSPEALEISMKNLGQDLSESGLADADLLTTIETMKVVGSTHSILFTGTADSLEKVKGLAERLDATESAEMQVQQLGQHTFLIYKIQYVPGPQLVLALKGLTSDLQRNNAMTKGELESINNLKWIKETNSLVFTGTPETLQKIELLIKKFDIPALSSKGEGGTVSNFVVYTPRFVPGEELIQILDEFQQNLVSAGVNNRNLYETITNLKWVPRTCSLIISGDPDSIARVEDLLKRFDIPSADASASQASIDTIQNTSFLIYKLQYHQGNEILSALKQIATDLTPGTAVGNQSLLNAVNSLQWIRVTNSLLASGEGDTLSKLRDLIQNLDVPLKQVFIEVLVIETELTNTQNFGLQWGGKMQFLNKFAAGTGNFPINAANSFLNNSTGTATTSTFQGTGGLAGPPPLAAAIPFVNGFDLGVIGDIIMHKGKSFITLGSLVNALQTDTDSTVILNPKIITQDNQTSTIFVGSNVPFIGSLVTTSSTILSSSSNIEYRDIGFNMTVTPTIGNNDVITLDISNDISEQINQLNIGQMNVNGSNSNNITGITTSHTAMSTKVHVPDKHFVVLSGMIRDSKARFKSGIPCLGGLPVIGAAFSENDRINAKRNVIIFMRPHIVNTYADYKEITDHQESVYKNQASLPVLKEEFDAGIDVVKQTEEE
jgi:type III secretion protein C